MWLGFFPKMGSVGGSTLSTYMESTEKISAALKLMNSKRNCVRRSVITLNLAWKDLEEHLECTKNTFEEVMLDSQVRENSLNLIGKSVSESLKEVELLRKSVESRCEELERREMEFCLFQQERVEYFRTREEQMEDRYADIKRILEGRIDDAVLKEERLESNVNLMWSELECVQEAIGSRSRELDEKQVIHDGHSMDLETLQIQIDKQLECLHAEEVRFEGRLNELLQRENQAEDLKEKYKRLSQDLNLKERALEDRSKQLDLIQKLNEEQEKTIELKGKELDCRKKSVDSVEASFNQYITEFHLKEKQFKLDKEALVLQSKELEVKREELDKKSKEIEQLVKDVEIEKEHLQKQKRDIELKEQRLTDVINSHVKVEKETPSVSGSAADINFTVTMNGKSLQMFLNDNVNNHDSMHEEIIKVLKLSRDPATVVLDAMEGFYPPHLTDGVKMFETSVVMKTCILLLRQLRIISSRIDFIVEKRAFKLAQKWMNKVSLTTHESLAVMGLLHLLASYDLVSSFDKNDTIRLLEIVAHEDQVYELSGLQCFKDIIPDFIKGLTEKKKYLLSVRFICKLDLVDKFPPEPLLRKHLNLWKPIVNNTPEAQNEALNGRITSIEEVIKCILEFKLQSQFPLEELERSLEKLSKQNRSENNEIRKQDDANVVVVDNRMESVPSVDTHMNIMIVNILANMDGRCLLKFLSEHSTELDIMQKDVSHALKMSSDSGRIVIVAIMEEFHDQKIQNIPNCSMMSYLFVLEILAGNIPIEIIKSPVVSEAAMKVAVEWKANLSWKKDPIFLLCFLQLVCTYSLTSEFDPYVLYNLCCSVADDYGGDVPELPEILSSSKRFPVSKILNVDQKRINRSILPTRAPWKSLPHGTIPDLFRLSFDPAKLLLDTMQYFFFSIMKDDLKGNGPLNMEIFLPLLKELIMVKVGVYNMKSVAFSFAVDWKGKLGIHKRTGEAFCFLLFLSIYELGSWFEDEVIIHLLNFCKNDFSGRLLRNFGLEKKMFKFIQKLITEEERVSEAISLIYDFELVEKFPPVPLLKSYLACAEEAARKRCHRTTRDKAVEREIGALLAVTSCISFHNLKSLFPPEPLHRRLKELELEKTSQSVKRHHAHTPESDMEAQRVKKVCNGISSCQSTDALCSASIANVSTASSYRPPQASYPPVNNTGPYYSSSMWQYQSGLSRVNGLYKR